jgi:hypothetical protein
MPELDMNNHAPRDCQLCVQVLQMLDTEEIIPQIKLMIDPQVSLTQSLEGCYMHDPREGQVVQL